MHSEYDSVYSVYIQTIKLLLLLKLIYQKCLLNTKLYHYKDERDLTNWL